MKALWANPLSMMSTSLDVRLNPHDVDNLALSRLLEEAGFDVWLHDAYVQKSKKSSWKNRIPRNGLEGFDCDVVLMNSPGNYLFDYMRSKYLGIGSSIGYQPGKREFDFMDACEWLGNFKGEVYLFSVDPRDNFISILDGTQEVDDKLKDDWCYDILTKTFMGSKVISPDKNLFPSRMKDRIIESDYWKIVDIPIYNSIQKSYYDTIYTGVKSQTDYRKKIVKTWLDTKDSYTAGDIKIKGVESITNHKKCTLFDSIGFNRDSKTSLVCGEPKHTWLTPRVMSSFTSGCIATIHPEFNGRHLIPNEVLMDQTFERVSEFNDDLINKQIYNRQLRVIKDLQNEYRKLSL